MKEMLRIQDLTKYYGKVRGIENLNLVLNKGEIYGFIGPNGAGKSTTIRSIMHLVNKNSGKVFVNGKEFGKDNLEIKKIIGYLPSEISLYDDMTVKEILDYHESFYDNIHDRRKNLVNRLQLDEKKKIEDLSLGNLKKLGIVLAFMHNPKLVILDEPTSGLDPIMQNNFFDILKEEKEKGTTILYSTHILSEVSKICDKVGIVKDGHLIHETTIEDLQKNNFNFITIISSDIDKIKKELDLPIILENKDIIKFKNDLEINLILNKLVNYKIDKLLIEDPTLEDLFMHYYN